MIWSVIWYYFYVDELGDEKLKMFYDIGSQPVTKEDFSKWPEAKRTGSLDERYAITVRSRKHTHDDASLEYTYARCVVSLPLSTLWSRAQLLD
ncbi:hypothetical protein ACTXT7_008651 [Hymenolepis weldensis]